MHLGQTSLKKLDLGFGREIHPKFRHLWQLRKQILAVGYGMWLGDEDIICDTL